jgi:S-adenosylmethionine-dependent methyltransferase
VSNRSHSQDKSFDSIAEKFQQNIYGTTKGQLRHEVILANLFDAIPSLGNIQDKNKAEQPSQEPMRIIDVGGGTGQMTATLVSLGHHVVLNDISQDTLDVAKQHIGNQDNVQYKVGKLQDIPLQTSYDLVVCHAVLEWLTSPFDAIDKLSQLLDERGMLSLSFFNLDAQRFGNILYGNLDYVQSNLEVKKKVKFSPNNPLRPKAVLAYLEKQGFEISLIAGVRCFHDYLKDRDHQISQYDKLKALELTYCREEPYLWLGKYFHVVAKKKG